MIYLNHFINDKTPLYGGANNISIDKVSSINEGNTANTLFISLPNHSGTHIDVPRHFFNDGKTLSDYPASFWVFHKPQLIDVPCDDGQLVMPSDIKSVLRYDSDILLTRTGYERYRNQEKYWARNPGLSAKLANTLRTEFTNIRAVGADIISITSRLHRNEGREAHRQFLCAISNSEPIVLIEDMSLINYKVGIEKIIVCPLMLKNGDGAPCTIIAI